MKSKTDVFPPMLLERPVAERLQYFRSKVIAHTRLLKADQDLMEALRHPGDATLIFVFGPSGVGKSTLCRRVQARLAEMLQPELLADPNRIPYVAIEAVSPEAGSFNWKGYYRRALLATTQAQALVDELRIREGRGGVPESSRTGKRSLFGKHVVTEELRLALEDTLHYHRPHAFFVDECQHLANIVGGRWFMTQMDNLKSLASMTHTLHVLVGTYGLLNLTNLSAQLARRSIHIHFSRYHFDQSEDEHAFKRVLLSFQNHMPIANMPDLVADYEYLYMGCVGCVGMLKNWLYRALASALEADEKSLTHRHLERSYDAAKVLEAATEVREGEQALTGDPRHFTRIRALLGMPLPTPKSTVTSSIPDENVPKPMGKADDKAAPAQSMSASKPRRVNVQRKPMRDAVGRTQP